jgi:hypothetical protein
MLFSDFCRALQCTPLAGIRIIEEWAEKHSTVTCKNIVPFRPWRAGQIYVNELCPEIFDTVYKWFIGRGVVNNEDKE